MKDRIKTVLAIIGGIAVAHTIFYGVCDLAGKVKNKDERDQERISKYIELSGYREDQV